MTISSAGIGSGLDVNSIVTQLMAIEQQPLTALQTKATTIQTHGLGVRQDQERRLDAARPRRQARRHDHLGPDDHQLVEHRGLARRPTTPRAGSYTVEVQALASVQTIATGSAVPATTTPGAGTLHIELGTWGAGQTSFTPKAGATAVDIAVTATDTLADVRDKINAAGAGVTALIMTDASGSRLLIRSNTSGAANAFRTSGIASLAFDPSAGVTTMTQSQTAADAEATVNGLAVTSTSNTLSNIVDGLTLNLSTLTTGPVTVNVVTDTEALKKTITDFAAAYTALVKLIATDTKYDPTTKKGGILQGDSAAVGLQRQLRTLAGATSGASALFGHLSDVGLELQADGSMTVNASKLGNALGNLAELKKLFANSDLVDPSQGRLRQALSRRHRRHARRRRRADDPHRRPRPAAAAQPEGPGRAQGPPRRHREADARPVHGARRDDGAAEQQSSYITQQIAAFNASNSSK